MKITITKHPKIIKKLSYFKLHKNSYWYYRNLFDYLTIFDYGISKNIYEYRNIFVKKIVYTITIFKQDIMYIKEYKII